ncbi:MAG: ribonuclease R [candidate division KSB1 bacterium]|nr:ribonuclease R [candidate division KSB1 bacterium]MDZ7317809.1 ribonuclease R [candidate division KSB1 bacterium]MDZ7341633.1 ribonuclease R [candidate division KSB1 bacterium]
MNIESKILELLQKNPQQTYKPKQLAKLLAISSQKYTTFKKKLKEMISEGKIFKYKKGRVGAGRKVTEVVGKLHVKTQGYGFLQLNNGDSDIFISESNMGRALHGDTVRVQLFARPEGRNQEGEVVEIVKRARQNIVGTFQQGKYWSIVVPDELKIQRDFYIAPEHTMNARHGQKVVVHLLEWEDEHLPPVGKVVEILGETDQAGVDIISVARSFDLPSQFSKKAIAECDRIAEEIPAAEIARRLDWRNELTFTIDPIDSKDFDDAVSLKVLPNGNYLLGVHIADVSHYVLPGSHLDRESQNRGTSVYLVDRVLPMLPERISNQVCCLKPNEDKLAFSVLIELTPSAEVVKYEIRESIIHSHHRFTYEEVQEIIDGRRKDRIFGATIMLMLELSQKLIRQREMRGSLDFASQEVRFKLNELGKPVAIEKLVQTESHRLIEEFMVLANSIVARHVAEHLKPSNGDPLPFPYRIHEKPSPEKLKDFSKFTQALGLEFNPRKRMSPKVFQSLQHSIHGSEIQTLVESVMIRTMMKARYSTKNEGHFGLALKHYCHFTSPIRRYPDLMAHRLLKNYLQQSAPVPITRRELDKICEHATEQEIKAMEAERASVKVKQLEFMQDKIGETFQGIISGVTSFGIFVEITDFLIEGMVHITNLRDDYYIYEETKYRLVGQYHGQVYQLGDPVVVMVALVNLDERIIDFELVESLRK